MLSSDINQKIAGALRAKDAVRLSTLRLLSSAFNYERIAKQHELTDEEEFVVIRREAKKRSDAIESIKQAQGKRTSSSEDELKTKLAKEEEELGILKEFLPEEMPDNELVRLVNTTIFQTSASGVKDMGKVIGEVLAKAKGTVDGKRVAEKVKEALETRD